VDTAIGTLPSADFFAGIGLSGDQQAALLAVNPEQWLQEAGSQAEFFTKFGDTIPVELWSEHGELVRRCSA
jgi:GTP-dependent phosphoenolpyruvate carboxykinase